MSSSRRKVEVVIVGGSSGAQLASALSAARAQFDPAKHNLTLITQLPYGVHLPATARMTVTSEGNLDSTDKAFIPYDKLFKPGNAGRVVHARVTGVTDSSVVLADGSGVPYNYLVLATGSVWTGATNFSNLSSDADVHAHVDGWRKKIQLANRIVVVGGGAVGIEMSGELKHHYPEKSITIVHAADKLLNPAYPDKFRDRAKTSLEAAGIRVILGDRVLGIPDEGLLGQGASGVTLQTSQGVTLEADLFIPALGPRPNTSYLTNFHNGETLSPTGFVHVTPTLNVKFGTSNTAPIAHNIFAMGDIINWNEQHMMMKAGAHLAIVKKNLLALLQAHDPTRVGQAPSVKLTEYKSGGEAILVTNGPKGGFGYMPILWGITFGNWFTAMVKSGGLFISMTRKQLGH